MPASGYVGGVLVATNIEKMVFDYLTLHRIPFEFQSHLIGGYARELGDTIADFVLTDIAVVLRVQGEYWHTGAVPEGRDAFLKAELEGRGYTVIDLQEADLTTRFESTMAAAVQGIAI